MVPLRFEWDERKARENARKHGVSFDQASEVFLDPLAADVYDTKNSAAEDRWLALGSCAAGLVVVCYVDRGDVIRIIIARRATAAEIRAYAEG